MNAERGARAFAVGALLGLAACTGDAVLPVAHASNPPPHPLTTLYHTRTTGDAFESGRAWLSVGEGQRAAEAWARAPLQMLTLPELRAVADVAAQSGDLVLARAAFEALLRQNLNDTSAHLSLGLLLAAVAPAEALPHLQAAAGDPAFAPLVSAVRAASSQSAQAVGWALLDAGQWATAEVAFHAAAAEPDATPLVWAGLALSRDFQGKDGSDWMEAAAVRAPNDAAVFALLSIHRRVSGDLEGSLTAQQRAVALAPDSAPLLAQLGVAYQRLGRLDEAAVWFERAQTLAGDDPRYAALLESVAQSEEAALGALLNSLATPSATGAP